MPAGSGWQGGFNGDLHLLHGDSGGPFFVDGTNIVVATTITGANKNCGGADINLRLDTQPVQKFLAPYV